MFQTEGGVAGRKRLSNIRMLWGLIPACCSLLLSRGKILSPKQILKAQLVVEQCMRVRLTLKPDRHFNTLHHSLLHQGAGCDKYTWMCDRVNLPCLGIYKRATTFCLCFHRAAGCTRLSLFKWDICLKLFLAILCLSMHGHWFIQRWCFFRCNNSGLHYVQHNVRSAQQIIEA